MRALLSWMVMVLVLLDGVAGARAHDAHAMVTAAPAGSMLPPVHALQPLQSASRRQCVALVVDVPKTA